MSKHNTIVRSDPYRWKAAGAWKRASQWRKWENVGLDPTLDLTDLVLNWTSGSAVDLQARGTPKGDPGTDKGAVTGIELERTIEGASTLTITLRDPNQRLFSEWARRMRPTVQTRRQRRTPVEVDEGWDPILAPNLLGRAMEVHLDGAVFRLVGVSYQHQNEEATLTFEDRIVYLLRRKRGERRASRAKVTRAQFILSLLREVDLTKPPFVCPELTVKQPIDKADQADQAVRALPRASTRALRMIPLNGGGTLPPAQARADTGAGLPGGGHTGTDSGSNTTTGTDLTVKGRKATPQQTRTGQQVLDACSQAGDNPRATKACVCACIVESEMQNLSGGDRDSRGVLQVRDSTAAPMGIDNRNVTETVTAFLKRGFWGKGGAISIARKNPGMTVGKIAQNTQGSAYPDRYDQVAAEAQKWLDAYGGGDLGATSEGGSYRKSYQYAREKDEDSWTAIQRLADEVAWRFFVVGEAVYFMSEQQLYRRRPRYEITADSDLLIDLQYDVDWGKPASECTATVALDRWGAPPGAVMLLSGFGPPDGRWLVASIRRDWFSPTAELTLKQPGKQKLEPAAERAQRAATATQNGNGAAADGSASGRVYNEAKAISDRALPYIWGGGHASTGRADAGTNTPSKNSGPPPGFDCSGYVCACLAAGGLGFKPGDAAMASGALMSWGESGPGERVTVWANAGHTFIEFTGMGAGKFADTGRNAAPPADRGPRLRKGTRSTAGFTARHWNGT